MAGWQGWPAAPQYNTALASRLGNPPELLALSVCVGHAELQRRGAGAGAGRAHAQQHHPALDALFGLGGGEQSVDLRGGRVCQWQAARRRVHSEVVMQAAWGPAEPIGIAACSPPLPSPLPCPTHLHDGATA